VTNRITKIILRGDIADLQAKMAVAAKSVGDTADKMTNASKESAKFRSGLTAVGSTAGKVGLVAAAGIGAIVVATANFEQSMSRVKAATHESASTMEELRAAAIKAGADTVFSATEAADAITAMSKAGVASGDILKGGLSGALSLASAGELDVASAAEIAATAMNQFGLAGKDIPHIADLLAAGAGKAMGEVTDFAAAMKFVGPVAHQMGISIEETTGTIAELAQQGVLGEQAGTSLRGMLTALTSPSKLAAKEMQNLGIQLYDASGQFVGLAGVAGQLHDTMGGLSNAERDQALGRIFGNEQITAARILYSGGAADVQKWTKAVSDDGYAAETAAIKLDNLKGDLEQLKGSLETALIGAGGGSQGPLRDLTQGATDAVNALNGLPSSAKNAATGLLGITAITGGALWFTAKTIKGVADMRVALDNLGGSGTKAAAAIRGVGLAGASVAVLYTLATGLEALNKTIDRSIPGVNTLTKDLLALNTATGVRAIVGDIGDLGDALNKVKDPGFFNDIDKLYGKVPVLGKLGQLGVSLLPGGEQSKRDLREATAAVDALDASLANIVQSGSPEQARATFDQLAKVYGLTGDQQKRLLSLMPQYKDALDGVAVSGALGADAAGKLGDAEAAGGADAQQAAADQAALAKALADSRDAANKTAHEFFGLGGSLDDSKVSLDDWITDLESQAKALRDFTKNAKDAGEKGLKRGLIAELEAAGPAGALRMQQLADASEKEIHRANRAWRLGQTAIDDYTDAVGGVPPSVATDLQVNGVPVAITAVAALKRLMDSLHDRNINVTVTKHTNATLAEAAANADGGTIPHAAAGWTVAGPRHPYGDKVLAYLAPGEEVITNRHGEADQFRADRAAGRIPAYVAGTPIQTPAFAGGAASSAEASRLLGYRDARDAHLAALRTALREIPIQRVPSDASLLYGAA